MSGGSRQPRIGLVLGAGGVLGGAWTAGALNALAAETGWDPASADYIVGTSAGSVIASLVAGGVTASGMLPDAPEELFSELIAPSGGLLLMANTAGRWLRGLPTPLPGSWRLSLSGLRTPRPEMVLRVFSGLVPQGCFSTDPIKAVVRKAAATGWVRHPNCWIVACDYVTGRRVTFGRAGAPKAEIASAAAASCAIPGFYCPERIDGRLYVDGGLHSMSNLDLVDGLGLDLVLCINPMSSRAVVRSWDPMAKFAALTRRVGADKVDHEARQLRAGGTRVALIEPVAEDLQVIGHNLMNAQRRNEVLEVALRTVRQQLRSTALRGAVATLKLEAQRQAEPAEMRAADQAQLRRSA
jgi:NTE family protein